MQFENLKKLFIKILIGSLIGAAGLAVIAVLIGEFSDILARSLFTLGLVAFHALASLSYIDNNEKHGLDKSLKLFTNTVFTIIILSFFTSVFGTWGILAGDIVGKLYMTYFIILFASLHGEMLAKSTGKDSTIDNIVYANYLFMAIVILLLLPVIWASGNDLGEFYYRLLAASGIVDATLTILSSILYKLYLQKHPEVKSTFFTLTQTKLDANGNPVQIRVEENKRHIHPLVWLLGIYIASQVVLSIVFAILRGF